MKSLVINTSSPFTAANMLDRELVLRMLAYEDTLIHGDDGQYMYKLPSYKPRSTLTVEYAIQRLVLHYFGFTTKLSDVEMYRSIYRNYSSDATVLQSVTYLRENKCLYYSSPLISVGDRVHKVLENCNVLSIDGTDVHNLFDMTRASPFEHVLIGAFSSS